MVKWTKDQMDAIQERNTNLLVSAAAGSGKTAVLVERIIQMILKDGVNLDELLIVTFTNAAAGEMRERIAGAIMKELEKKDHDQQHLRKQMNLLSGAFISTLHAFCIEVVRRFFHIIDIDPNFRIGDMTETSIMKIEILEALFEDEYEKQDPLFLGLVERFGGNREDDSLKDMVLSLNEFIQSQPYPHKWLENQIKSFNMNIDEFEQSIWHKKIMDQIKIRLKGAKDLFLQAQNICNKPNGPLAYLSAIEDDLIKIDEWLENKNFGLVGVYHALGSYKSQRLGRVSKDVDNMLKEKCKDLRDQGKEIIKKIKEEILFKDPVHAIKDLNELYPYMRKLYELIVEFDGRYHDKKMEKGMVDFNDLEHYALSILEHKEVAKVYKDRFKYIFVDEYQDSNIVQETLLGFIKREDNLFMVGDVKQSIYRFRLSDPSLFIQKYETFLEQKGTKNTRIDLSQNFRSRKEVIDGVNFIFKNIMSKAFGELEYDQKAYLYEGAQKFPMENPYIHVCMIEKKEEEIDELEELESVEIESRVIAKQIKKVLKTEIFDETLKSYRKVTYKDIVILLRSTKNYVQSYLEAFVRENIPAYADVNTGYFEAIEVNIFMNLLRIIDNRRQDVPLLSIMRSSIGGFHMEELIEIRVQSDKNTYYEALEEYLKIDNPLGGKCRDFIHTINHYKKMARYVPMDQLIFKLLKETGYYDYIGAMPGGIQRQANLRVLVQRAKEFQNTSLRGIFQFIRFMDKLKNSSGDMGVAKTLGENDNVVRIMSIHKSKGLEFPIVIVGAMGKQFNLRDTQSSVLYHKDLGIGPKYVDPIIRQYTDTYPKVAMKETIKLESLSEEMRILYVALTRAKEKLILVGSIRNIEATAKKWRNPLTPFYLSKAKHYMDWIGLCLMRHEDGEILRKWANIDDHYKEIIKDPSKWKIERINKEELRIEDQDKKMNELAFKQFLNHLKEKSLDKNGFVAKRLNWKYKNEVATNIPSKLSVTEIKRIAHQEVEKMGMNIPTLIQMPKFMETKKSLTPAQRGSIIHFVMQHLDLKNIEEEHILKQINHMVKYELLKPEEAETINIRKITTFFKSFLGKRMIDSKNVYREVPFNFVKKAKKVIHHLEECEDELLVQGVIDCYFEEEDGVVLIDYKSDYVSLENKQNIIDQYKIQIDLYKEALEKINGKPVKESYLYLFNIDEAIKL